jgi:hypothetical protein
VNAAAFEPERIKRTNERNFAIVKVKLFFVGAKTKGYDIECARCSRMTTRELAVLSVNPSTSSGGCGISDSKKCS